MTELAVVEGGLYMDRFKERQKEYLEKIKQRDAGFGALNYLGWAKFQAEAFDNGYGTDLAYRISRLQEQIREIVAAKTKDKIPFDYDDSPS